MSYPQNMFAFLVFFLYGVIRMPLFTQPEMISCVKVWKMQSFKEVIKLKLKVMTGKILLTFTSKVQ